MEWDFQKRWPHSAPMEISGKTVIDFNGSNRVKPTLDDTEKSHS